MTARWAWLFDIGSTFTKVLAVDLDDPGRVVTAQAPTTVATGVRDGFDAAIAAAVVAGAPDFKRSAYRAASSSAAGGLKIAVLGLSPRLTLKAAQICALGAGARVVGAWTHRITDSDVRALAALSPDVVLLTGGFDGGDRSTVLANATRLAAHPTFPLVVVAGNRDAAPEVAATLSAAGIKVEVVANVLPELDQLDVQPARESIRARFLSEIVVAKGVAGLRPLLTQDIVPTPSAVMNAAGFVADNVLDEPVLVVEVGGATTNVHSCAEGAPRASRTVRRGLAEPRLMRTVEGDLGVRISAPNVLEMAGGAWLATESGGSDARAIERYVERIGAVPSTLPRSAAECAVDAAMAAFAAGTAIARHCGTLKEVPTIEGPSWVQYGRDLRGVPIVIGTGGSVLRAKSPAGILHRSLRVARETGALAPESPRLLVDSKYALYAIGMLAQAHPDAAKRLATATLEPALGEAA